jgi:F0F1-type ATP synthase membrane subunit a
VLATILTLVFAAAEDGADAGKAIALGVILFLFEVGLVATLQAFIFATLSAIYLGGAVAEHH